MASHFLLMLLFALLVSVVFAVLMKDRLGEQVRFGGLLLAAFVGCALLIGWLMYPFPR